MRLYLNKALLLSVLLFGLFSQTLLAKANDSELYPKPDSGYVTDNLNLLSYDEQERIETWLWQVESRTNVEIIVVVINSIKDYPGTKNNSIEDFATALFNTYGIGNKATNNGVLLLVAKQDRKVRIELGKSYGYFRDQDAKQIIESVIIPEFKKGDFVAGITNGTKAIIAEFAGMRVGFPWFIAGIFALAAASILIAVSLFRNGKRGWGYVFVGLAMLLILLAIYLLIMISRHMPDTPSSGWSSGGMGGFGGGSSGGGGATGGW